VVARNDLGVAVRNLARTYEQKGRGRRRALRGVSFDVPYGQVVGLLGPNGAGKTSCVKVLTTLLTPTSGSAVIAGADVVRQPTLVQRRCGVSFGGDKGLYEQLSAVDNLRFFGTMYGLHGAALRRRAAELLETVRLADRATDKVRVFSRGMRQRLHIARALLHDPQVLFLDEPSSGLDPESARDLRALVGVLREQGRAVLLTTHDLVEAESVCDEILILIDGRIARRASPLQLREEAARSMGTVIEFQTPIPLPVALVESVPGLLGWTWQQGAYRVHCSDATSAMMFLLQYADQRLHGLDISPPSLEDAYLTVVR
jgi:ABC-2 type transport system ATP-binding protein